MDEERKLMLKKLKLKLSNGFLPASREISSKFGKKLTEISEEYKGKGNNLYLDKKNHNGTKHQRILSLYNKSIAFAPNGSEALATAYGNKSALLRHVCKYAECICEIDKALKISNSNCLKIKLYCRKAECLTALNSLDNHETLEKAKLILNDLEESEKVRKSFQKLIMKTELTISEKRLDPPKKDEHREQLKNLIREVEETDTSDYVEVKYSKKYGVHLIAARDFKPGETIIVEKPHCWIVNAIYEHSYLYCGHCTQYLWECVPCDHCTWCMFCSEQCKSKAWEEYHDIECEVTSSILALGAYIPFPISQLTVRILIKALRQAGSIVQLRTDVESINNREDYKSFSTNGNIENYKRFYSLRGNLFPDELEEYSKIFATVLILFAKHSSILGKKYEYHQIEKLIKNEEAVTLAALLLKTCKIAALSCQGLFGYNDLCQHNIGGGMCMSECCGQKACVVPTWASIPLSCCPNVSRCVIYGTRSITFTLSPIKKGDQLFTSIYSVYKMAPKSQRQKVFKKRYGFDCNCQVCAENWTDADFTFQDPMESLVNEHIIMKRLEAAKSSPAMKRNSDIGTLLMMKEIVEEAWRYFTLPSATLIKSVESFIETVNNIHAKALKKMPDECANCD